MELPKEPVITDMHYAVFGSYGWSGEGCKMAEERLKSMGFMIIADSVRTSFTPRPEALIQSQNLGNAVAETISSKG